jgi:hypothetical protein
MREVIGRLRDEYNVPADTPRDEMWVAIEAGLEAREEAVVHLEVERRKRSRRLVRPLGWAAAAAAVLVLGVGIGRMTTQVPVADVAADVASDPTVLRMAAVQHLGRSGSLLTLVRADARQGRVDPAVGTWARGLLTQTRLLLDTPDGNDPALRDLLEDLELVLVQVVGVAELAPGDDARARSELTLALEGLQEREVLPRIQAVTPTGPVLAGT